MAKKRMAKKRRRQFYFKQSFQGKYVLTCFIIACLCISFFTLLFMYFSANTLSITYDNNSVNLGNTPEILLNKLLSINWFLIVIFGFFIFF